jgi:predicted MFS family arabinose efflux permease
MSPAQPNQHVGACSGDATRWNLLAFFSRETKGAGRWSNVARALRSRNYRLFFMGQGLSLIGTWMQRTALLWLVSTMFADVRIAAFWLGMVAFCSHIPALLLTPIAGALADRWDRRRMLLATQLLAMVQAFALSALVLTGTVDIRLILLLALWIGVVDAVDIPTRQAFVIELVDRPEDLHNAIALNSSIVNGGRLIGPALGGVVTALFGAGACFLLNGMSYLAVLAALLAMRISRRRLSTTRAGVIEHLAEGFRYASTTGPIRSLLLLMALVSLAGFPYASLLPAFAKHILHLGPNGYGTLVAGAGMGALVGAIVLAGRDSSRGLDKVIAAAPALLGATMIGFSLSRSYPLSLMLMPLLGVGQIMLMAAGNTVLQTIVDEDKRGRVMSFYSLAFMGMMPLGSLLAGFASRHFGPSATMAVGGAVCMAGALVFVRNLPTVRNVMHPFLGGQTARSRPDRPAGVPRVRS